MSDDVTTSEVARVLLDHDADRMECMDHDKKCCPTCDAHDFADAYKHQADALAEAGLLREEALVSACADDGISMCPKMAYSNKQLQRQVSGAQATIDALNERCRILVDEVDRLRAQIERDRADLDAAATMRERLESDVERAVAQCRHLHQEGLSRHDWQISQIRALATATGPNLSCGGYGIGDDGCFVAGLAQRVLAVLDGKDAP